MTPFAFEHVLRAASPAVVFAAYVERDHTAQQDAAAEIDRREYLEFDDGPERFRRVSKMMPRRQPPAFMRALLSGPLELHETVTWTKAEDTIRIEVRPSLLGGKALIRAGYRLVAGGPGEVRRLYAGDVTVDVRLIGGRVERAIIDDLARSLEISARCTQAWLDRAAAPGT